MSSLEGEDRRGWAKKDQGKERVEGKAEETGTRVADDELTGKGPQSSSKICNNQVCHSNA